MVRLYGQEEAKAEEVSWITAQAFQMQNPAVWEFDMHKAESLRSLATEFPFQATGKLTRRVLVLPITPCLC